MYYNVLWMYYIYTYIWYHMTLHIYAYMILYDTIWYYMSHKRNKCVHEKSGLYSDWRASFAQKNNCIASEALSAHRKRQHSSWKRLGKSAHFHAVVHLCPFVESTFHIFWLLADFQHFQNLPGTFAHPICVVLGLPARQCSVAETLQLQRLQPGPWRCTP